MKILNHDVALASSRVYEQQDREMEELREWGKREQPGGDEESEPSKKRFEVAVADRVSISSHARFEFASHVEQIAVDAPEAPVEGDPEETAGFDSKLVTLKRMIEAITGREIKLSKIFEHAPRGNAYGMRSDGPPKENPQEQKPPEESPPVQEWGMSYRHYESHYEYESVSFSAGGMVQTADGREISFSVDLAMSREYFSEEMIEINAGAPLIDPLVINYEGRASELADMTFEFDLNVDGQTEVINNLKPGHGFLVFDRNEDGIVNDGSELFGPTTGDGFSELAEYDDDGNNWIDENDAIYEKLSVWRRDGAMDYLDSLKDANVGAIYLGNTDTQFDLKNDDNDLYGRIQKTGVYLKESGEVGTIQQIDLSA